MKRDQSVLWPSVLSVVLMNKVKRCQWIITMSGWSEAALNASFRSPGRRGFNLESKLSRFKTSQLCRSEVFRASGSHLSVSRDTQPWLGLLAKLFLLKGRFSASGCRKNFLDTSMTRSTYPKKTHSTFTLFYKLNVAFRFICHPHLLLTDPSVLQKDKTNFCESRFQLCAQLLQLLVGNIFLSQAQCAKVHHWDAHFQNTKVFLRC